MIYELNKLHAGLTYDQYHNACVESKAVRSSYFKHLMKSPRHLKVALEEPKEASDAMEFGKMVHALFENSMDFLARHVVEPKFEGKTLDGKMSDKSKAAKEKRQAWIDKLPKDAILVKEKDAARLYAIHNVLKEKNLISNILRGGIKEQSLWVKDPETGLTLSCRPDFITEKNGYCIDLKTTRNAHPDFFLNQIFSTRGTSPFYLIQASHYTHCLKTAGLTDGKSFIFIAMENQSPFEMRVYPLDEGALDAGDAWRKKLTRLYSDCLMADKWPGYDDTAYPTGLPSWLNDPPIIGEEMEE